MNDQSSARTSKLRNIKQKIAKIGGLPRKILDALPIGVFITDQEGQLVFVNLRYISMSYYERHELIGQHFTFTVLEKDKDLLNYLHNECTQEDQELEQEWQMQRKDRQKFPVLTHTSRLRNDETENPLIITFLVDTSSYHVTNGRLNASIDLLNQKLTAQEVTNYIANHDLKNNINGIWQSVQFLKDLKPSKAQKQWIDIIEQLSGQTLNMLNTANDLLRMENGKYVLTLSQCNLLEIVQRQIDLLTPMAKQKKIKFITFFNQQEVYFSTTTLTIAADRVYLERLFANLTQNALEASPEHEMIDIQVDVQDHLTVKIHNQGVIPQRIRDHFFEKYATAGKEKGTGLGTYIARLITEAHQGDIRFNTGEADGTTIIIEFPISICHHQDQETVLV